MTDDVLRAPPLAPNPQAVRRELGPWGRWLARRFFEPVRFPDSAVIELKRLSSEGFVVHVMRTSAWVNYLYLAWASAFHALPPIRAAVNVRRWFTRPFTHAAMRGDFRARLDFARSAAGSALVFLRESAFNAPRGVEAHSDPFPALVEFARSSSKPVYLVPELFVWEKWQQKLSPSVFDRIFGSPEAPGFLHSLGAFLRNFRRAQYRVGEPLELRSFIADQAGESTERIARKVRGTLNQHLARETRVVFGPPRKETDRLIEEAMRDRAFQTTLKELAAQKGKPEAALAKEAKRNFNAIAARYSPTVVGLAAPLMHWVFNRIYDGIEVDEVGLERAMKAAVSAPVCLTPSHKSHVDYLVMSYVLWQRGYSVPLVAAGANLSFFPLGPFFRRGGAFFLRRSFKGDPLYTATFKAYLKKLVHDGIHHEFFPEGGRSRTGKLLQPKLGLFTWLTDAVLEGARDDLLFVPVAIDYERVVEGASYKAELAGGEKKPEDIKALLSAPAVLAENYGRIHLRFDEPVSLAKLMKDRGLDRDAATEEQKKALVRALGNRVMYGISKVSTVTPHALLASALLAHRRRGAAVREITDRVLLLRRMAEDLGAPFSKQLSNAPADPSVLGPISDAMRMFAREGFVRIAEARGEPIYQVEDDRRQELVFYKNTLMNLVAGRTIVATAMVATGATDVAPLREAALFLSRLFKFEFIYPVGHTFERVFDDTVEQLGRLGIIERAGDRLTVAPGPSAASDLRFIADLLLDFVESYALAAKEAAGVPEAGLDKKELLKRALENGRADFLAGTLTGAEALSKPNLENALLYLVDQKHLVEADKKLKRGPKPASELLTQLQPYLRKV